MPILRRGPEPAKQQQRGRPILRSERGANRTPTKQRRGEGAADVGVSQVRLKKSGGSSALRQSRNEIEVASSGRTRGGGRDRRGATQNIGVRTLDQKKLPPIEEGTGSGEFSTEGRKENAGCYENVKRNPSLRTKPSYFLTQAMEKQQPEKRKEQKKLVKENGIAKKGGRGPAFVKESFSQSLLSAVSNHNEAKKVKKKDETDVKQGKGLFYGKSISYSMFKGQRKQVEAQVQQTPTLGKSDSHWMKKMSETRPNEEERPDRQSLEDDSTILTLSTEGTIEMAIAAIHQDDDSQSTLVYLHKGDKYASNTSINSGPKGDKYRENTSRQMGNISSHLLTQGVQAELHRINGDNVGPVDMNLKTVRFRNDGANAAWDLAFYPSEWDKQQADLEKKREEEKRIQRWRDEMMSQRDGTNVGMQEPGGGPRPKVVLNRNRSPVRDGSKSQRRNSSMSPQRGRNGRMEHFIVPPEGAKLGPDAVRQDAKRTSRAPPGPRISTKGAPQINTKGAPLGFNCRKLPPGFDGKRGPPVKSFETRPNGRSGIAKNRVKRDSKRPPSLTPTSMNTHSTVGTMSFSYHHPTISPSSAPSLECSSAGSSTMLSSTVDDTLSQDFSSMFTTDAVSQDASTIFTTSTSSYTTSK